MKKNFLFLLMMLAPVFAWAAELTNDNVRIQSFTYQGDDTQSKIVVEYYNGSEWKALTKGVDYTVQFYNSDDVNVTTTIRNQGDYYAMIDGMGDYSGTDIKKTFKIKKAGLTVNLLNAFRDYGQADDETEVIIQINGYKAGDDEDTAPVIMTVKSAACVAAGGVKGQYTIDDATGVADNYDVGVDIQSTAKLTIRAKNIEDIWVVSNDASVEYNGNAQEPAVVVKDKYTDEVIDPANYDVVYNGGTDAINVGTDYAITVTAKENYVGDVDSKFNIDPLTLTAADIVIGDIDAVTYKAEAWTPEATVTGKGFTLTKGTDFEWEYDKNTDASEEAEATVKILTTSPNFTFTGAELKVTQNFTINPRSIVNEDGSLAEADGFNASGFGSKTYKGAAWEITPNISYAPQGALTNGVDYTLSYENNVNVTYDEKGKVATAAVVTVTAKGNFTGVYERTFKIGPRSLTAAEVTVTVNGGADVPYEAQDVNPEVVVYDALAGIDDYLTDADFDIKEWGADIKNVGTTSVTVEGKGNYKGEVKTDFVIGKGKLYIQPVSGSCAIGSVPDMKWDWVDGKGPKGADKDIAKDEFFTGVQPIVKRVEPGLAVGTYNLMVVLDGDDANPETNVTHPNYDVIAVNKDGDDYVAQWEITKQNVVIKSKEIDSEEYGYALPAVLDLTAKDKFPFEVEGLIYNEEITALTYVVKQKDGDKTYVGGENLPVGTYVVEIQNPKTGTENYVYDLTEAKADFVITPKAVTIAINNATKTYGGDDPVFTYTKPVSTELANGEEWDDLGLTPTLTREKGEVIGKEYAINGELVAENYTFTFTPGVFTITPGVFNLDRVPKDDFADAAKNTAAEYVKNYAGQTVDVQFSMYATEKGVDEQEFKAKKWYSLVLPFETNIQELSAAFGYAVVNTLAGMNGDKVRFALHMDETLPANTPFLVKIWKDKKLSEVDGFKNKTIVAPDPEKVDENGDPYVVEDGVRFIGTYKGKVDGFRSNEWFFTMAEGYNEYYKGNDTNTTYLRPLGAYLQAQPGVEVRGIEVQEADGTYTAIEAVEMANNNAESLYTIDGKKVQKAAQKGVYIQNGKKVILK